MFAQNKSITLWFGASNYMGDLTNKLLDFRLLRPAFGFYATQYINKYVGLRMGSSFGVVYGNDKYAVKEILKQRNLSFKSNIVEAYLAAQFDILPKNNVIVPYLSAGVGVFHFNPKAKLNGKWYALQPLGTEGQGLSSENTRLYCLTQMYIPFSFGTRVKINNKIFCGIEFLFRKTFTDYLDDVSTVYYSHTKLLQKRGEIAATLADRLPEYLGENKLNAAGTERGSPKSDDYYHFYSLTIGYNLSKPEIGISCPKF